MPNREVFLKGKVKFANNIKRLSKYGKWDITIYPDAPSLELVNKLIEDGIKNELKKDEDGHYITFSRPPEKLDRAGRRYTLTPPSVIDGDGRAFDGSVGNGSDVGVKLETYGGTHPIGGKYHAARLAGVKVFELVPYIPEEQATDKFEKRTVSGFSEQKPQVQNW